MLLHITQSRASLSEVSMSDIEGQSRSSQAVAAQPGTTPDLFGEGVGGRQPDPPFPPQGGGYPDIRGISNFRAPDPRIDDLRKMGLPAIFIQAAMVIGVDAFLAFWRIVDGEPSFRTAKGIEIYLRPYRSFLRYQRNRYIEHLNSVGHTPGQIEQLVKLHLGERISKRNIYHVITKDYYRAKVRAAMGSEAPRQEHLSLAIDEN